MDTKWEKRGKLLFLPEEYQYLWVQRREEMEGKMYINITHITGITKAHGEQLQDAGIFSLDDLIEATRPENLADTIQQSGVWSSAILAYGALARAIFALEKDFNKRVNGGYLLFVEDELAEEPPDDESRNPLTRIHYGFRVVGSTGPDRHYTRTTRHGKEASGEGIFVPARQWVRLPKKATDPKQIPMAIIICPQKVLTISSESQK
jgi:hypothetical protein